jgi:hypothetical protein
MTTTTETTEEHPESLDPAALRPYFSITVLECLDEDADRGFGSLTAFLRGLANNGQRSIAVRITGETSIGPDTDIDHVEGIGSLRELGLDQLYAVTRERRHAPGWTVKDTRIIDVTNELTLAVRRNHLVAIRTENSDQVLAWADRETTPYQRLPTDIIAATFDGDGKALWLRGMHRRRVTKPDSKMLTGGHLQLALDPLGDSTYAMNATRIDFASDEAVNLRGNLTVSPTRSHISSRAMPSLNLFLAASAEALTLLDKGFASEQPLALPYPELAVLETELSNAREAFDIQVADPDEVRGEPDTDAARLQRVELLRDALLEVRGDPKSASFVLVVGRNGAEVGRLKIQPVAARHGITLDVRYAGPPSAEAFARPIRDAIGSGDLLSVFYASGHTFNDGQLYRQNLTTKPFPFMFADFTGFAVTKEKPVAFGDQAIHDQIGVGGDNSLFAWVVRHFDDGWLICDDGAGEIADFLHLSNTGTLSAIHVKAAHNSSVDRRIAVTAFEQVVSQALKNARMLDFDGLAARLSRTRISRPACWRGGKRVENRAEFIQMLAARGAADRTGVVIVQPHLRSTAHDRARTAIRRGRPSRESHSLVLLDNLLQSAHGTVIGLWDDFTVVGSK